MIQTGCVGNLLNNLKLLLLHCILLVFFNFFYTEIYAIYDFFGFFVYGAVQVMSRILHTINIYKISEVMEVGMLICYGKFFIMDHKHIKKSI